MNKDIIAGKCSEMKGQLKQKWGKLSDDDITQAKGAYEELVGLLRKHYGYQKDEANHEIELIMHS